MPAYRKPGETESILLVWMIMVKVLWCDNVAHIKEELSTNEARVKKKSQKI